MSAWGAADAAFLSHETPKLEIDYVWRDSAVIACVQEFERSRLARTIDFAR